ncbi:hypothetical protein [Leptospira interrogans]|uniref:hypothetical protein n=1 Tax=Leptospira interrogans TaxID=173 RepID=UPI0002BB4FB0|nr:hypothetical protein [Leptospira interrogans]MCR8649129.1 hypothetical protein [Leptospira interrogans serovar Bataviae]OAM86100.1 hypothetical protein A1343_15820 [Leptospira interrogans serovar Bataviae]QOI40458.1 hypothetical protein Lepto1548_19620 [Leptospira interrogans serovar Bataviae]
MLNNYITQLKTGSTLYKRTVILSLIGIGILLLGNVFARISATETLFPFFFLFGFLTSVIALILLIISAVLRHGPITLYVVSILIFFISLFPQTIDSNFYSVWYDESPVTTNESLKISGEIYTEGEILVNGNAVERSDKKWIINYPLALGENVVKVVLKRPSGYEKFTKEFKVERVTLEELARRKAEEKANQLALKRKAEEDAKEAERLTKESIKEADADELAEMCNSKPQKAVKIEKFTSLKGDFNSAHFRVLVYNPCPIPLKDFRFHITYNAQSGTAVDAGLETVYQRIEPGKRKWLSFENLIWNDQAVSTELEIYSVSKI